MASYLSDRTQFVALEGKKIGEIISRTTIGDSRELYEHNIIPDLYFGPTGDFS